MTKCSRKRTGASGNASSDRPVRTTARMSSARFARSRRAALAGPCWSACSTAAVFICGTSAGSRGSPVGDGLRVVAEEGPVVLQHDRRHEGHRRRLVAPPLEEPAHVGPLGGGRRLRGSCRTLHSPPYTSACRSASTSVTPRTRMPWITSILVVHRSPPNIPRRGRYGASERGGVQFEDQIRCLPRASSSLTRWLGGLGGLHLDLRRRRHPRPHRRVAPWRDLMPLGNGVLADDYPLAETRRQPRTLEGAPWKVVKPQGR